MDDSSTYTTPSADGTTLFGYIWPCKTPRAVMALVHGFGEHSGRYKHMASALGQAGIAVVTLDLRGHGRSNGKRGVVKSYEDFRADISALRQKLDILYPDLPHILYGHSMGGALVLDHGLDADNAQGLRAIIASAPLIALAEPPPAIATPLVKCLSWVHPKGVIKQPIDGTKISTLKLEQRLYLSDALNHGQCGFRTALGMVTTGESITERAPAWDMPLLLLHGRDDVLTDFTASEAFAKNAKNTEFHAFDNCAHELHNDIHRAQVYRLMIDFIERRIA